ncbi:uncharacterized protein [Prorops nasuta]|uniref:uncharacterized protein n=1 Tax=Prorops nasuta TaxID=863751 RepID=UPI0034CE8DBA
MDQESRFTEEICYIMTNSLFGEDAWCYWVVSIGALLSFVAFLICCICSCRRNENKSEFQGLTGMVTINKSETEGFNRLPSADISQVITQDAMDNGKRTTSANRSLPDIPRDKNGGSESTTETVLQDIYETTETISDMHSELYATVCDKEDQKLDRKSQDGAQKNSLTENSSSGYQYARCKSPNSSNSNTEEHSYAQVQNVQKIEANQVKARNLSNPAANTESPSTSTSPALNPIAPPRTRKSSSHNSLLITEPHGNIQAANAISGGVQANQDLPYMTPPLLMPLPHPPQSLHNNSQQHFSGDSQDSKGYTSISVREPLANIRAQTKAAYQRHQATRPSADSHYATVSDDSDEMYAAIDEQEKVYTSGSETYAQIQPTAIELTRTQEEPGPVLQQPLRLEDTHAPQPPSVDSLRHVAHAHSRQASSSSANSSIINTGSPKPEKRQANSPLPPPPEIFSEMYASVDKRPKSEDRSRSSLSTGKSLEDMYAKVMKKKKDIDEQETTSFSNICPETSRKLSLIEISRASWSSHDSVEIQKKELDSHHSGNNSLHYSSNNSAHYNANSSSLYSGSNSTFHIEEKLRAEEEFSGLKDYGYEAVMTTRKSLPANYGTKAESPDPNYEVLHPQSTKNSNYANNASARNGTDSLATYSVPFKHRQISNASSEDPGYERVRLRKPVDLEDTDSEPNYESMPHDSGEPNYASVCRPCDSDTDPNYESVSQGDPNYESVKYMSVNHRTDEPPYEQLNSYKSRTNADNYAKVRVRKVADDYERISKNQQSNNGDTDDEQYIQV